MSIRRIYLDFLSKPETRTLKAGNIRLKHLAGIRLNDSPVVKFISVVISRYNVQKENVFGFQVQAGHSELHLREHLSANLISSSQFVDTLYWGITRRYTWCTFSRFQGAGYMRPARR